MTVAAMSPTIRQRELGLRLRNLRNTQGKTVEEVAKELMCSAAKISRLETGARKPVLRDVRDLCNLYEVEGSEAAELMALAREAREPGWWTEYDDLNLTPYIGLEQEASSITSYCMHYLHGLVQTEDYARTIIKAVAPRISPEIHQQRVEATMRRQERLDSETAPRYRLLLDEATIHRPVGGPTVMAAQITKLLELVADEKVTLQIVPFSIGTYPVADVSFTLLEFSEPMLSPVVYVQGFGAGQYHDRKADITRYREAIEDIRDLALSPRDSLKRLAKTCETYTSGQPPRRSD